MYGVGTYHQGAGVAGFWSDLWGNLRDVVGDLGGDPAIIAATARAFASPTQGNIRAVQDAYRARGAVAPPELMEQLYSRYYQSIRDNPVGTFGQGFSSAGDILPFAIAGIVLLWAVNRR